MLLFRVIATEGGQEYYNKNWLPLDFELISKHWAFLKDLCPAATFRVELKEAKKNENDLKSSL